MKRFVVYTVQTGGYDNVQQPLVVDDDLIISFLRTRRM